MDFNNTIQALQKLGNNVVKEGKGVLRKTKKSSGNLYKDFNYLVTNQKDSVTLEFEFGRAEDYWQFVDEGVRGVGGFKGSGRARGQGSPFKYSSKMPPRKPLIQWIKSKGLKGRDAKGRFISNNSFGFLIQRSIFQRGLTRTQFFSKPFTEQLNKQTDNITEAFADDIELALEQI
jgi:hypothetical protein